MTDNSNHRRADRLQHELLVAYRVDYRTVGGFVTDWAVNLSRGGMFINTQHPAATGSTVKLILSLPDGTSPFELTGRVARVIEVDTASRAVPGMAVEFIDIDQEKRDRIERFVEKLRKELPDDATIPPGRTTEIKKG
jgi:type IV pilus assembly protein PilZ